MLGITIDNNLSFQGLFKGLCIKASQKVTILLRIEPYLDLSEKSTIFKSIIKSQLITY